MRGELHAELMKAARHLSTTGLARVVSRKLWPGINYAGCPKRKIMDAVVCGLGGGVQFNVPAMACTKEQFLEALAAEPAPVKRRRF